MRGIKILRYASIAQGGTTHIHVYLGEFATKFENIFYSMNQGPRWDRLMKKTIGQKSRDTVPLT
jgi:hypothetical protein